MKVPRDMKPLVQAAREAGWEVTMSGGGHLRFEAPNGELVFTSSSPSCRRAAANTRAELRRKGLDI